MPAPRTAWTCHPTRSVFRCESPLAVSASNWTWRRAWGQLVLMQPSLRPMVGSGGSNAAMCGRGEGAVRLQATFKAQPVS